MNIDLFKQGVVVRDSTAIECILSFIPVTAPFRLSLHVIKTTTDLSPHSNRVVSLSLANRSRWNKLESGFLNELEIPFSNFFEFLSLDLRNFKGKISQADPSSSIQPKVDHAKPESSNFQAQNVTVENGHRLVLTVLGFEIDLNDLVGLGNLDLSKGTYLNLLFVPFRGKPIFLFYYLRIVLIPYNTIVLIPYYTILVILNYTILQNLDCTFLFNPYYTILVLPFNTIVLIFNYTIVLLFNHTILLLSNYTITLILFFRISLLTFFPLLASTI